MKRNKDVKGYKINCPNYAKCPLCFGCRNFNMNYKKCVNNCYSKKDNCNTLKHRADLISKMLVKDNVNL